MTQSAANISTLYATKNPDESSEHYEHVSVQESDSGPSKIASFLRYAGATAVVLSAVIYMLQGIETVDVEIRQWTYLILMSAMAVGGYISRFKLGDVLAARLFFALAVLLVPVQFSQLGGMIHVYVHGMGENTLATFWNFSDVSWKTLMLSLSISSVMALALSITSFSILARYKVKWLAAAFLLLNLSLLVPERFSVGALMLTGGMLAILFTLRTKIFTQHHIFKTREALVLRLIMTLPFVIAVTRSAFYLDAVSGLCSIGMFIAYMVAFQLPQWITSGQKKYSMNYCRRLMDTSLFCGTLIAGIAWSLFCLNQFYWASFQMSALILMLPIIALLFFAYRRAHLYAVLYKNLSSIAALMLGLCLMRSDPLTTGAFISLIGAVLMGAWGVGYREKFPLLVAAALGFSSIASLLVVSLSNVSVNVWLVLAVAGVALVLTSSIIEKYGRIWMGQMQQLWNDC